MNQVKAGAVLNYISIILNMVVGLVYTPYMLRMLGQSEYGLYSLAASVIAYLTVLDLGFGNAIIRYTAKFISEGKKKEQEDMFGMFFLLFRNRHSCGYDRRGPCHKCGNYFLRSNDSN